MRETFTHKAAFEAYYAAGASRSLASLAVTCCVSEKSCKRWSVEFHWQQRIQERDEANARRLEIATDASLVEVKAQLRKVAVEGLRTFADLLQKGRLKVTRVADFERLVKTYLLLSGEPTENLAMAGPLPVSIQEAIEQVYGEGADWPDTGAPGEPTSQARA